jgi:hypothetical protein
MTNELLISVREQAKQSSPAVRAAALLRIARVQTVFDADQARTAFKVALEATQQLPGEDCKLLLEHAELGCGANSGVRSGTLVFGRLRTSDEQAEQHRRVVCRAAL